jgi:hypothetical protein
MGLAYILILTKDFYTTDPRDKIYGCLGLLSMREPEAIKPDYQKPTELLFLEVTKYLLEHYRCFYSIYSMSTSRQTLSRASPSWVPDFSAQETWSPCNPKVYTYPRFTPPKPIQSCVFFQDHSKVLATTGLFFDTIEVAIELKSTQDLLLAQIPELERLAQNAVNKKILSDFKQCFTKLKNYEDVFSVLTGGRNNPLRGQYEVLTGRVEVPLYANCTASEFAEPLLWLMNHILPGRYFFITKMGFVGVAVARVRKNDSVTFLFGEIAPTILRPRGFSYNMVGAAYVSGIMHGELTGDMYQSGLIKERTFLIR